MARSGFSRAACTFLLLTAGGGIARAATINGIVFESRSGRPLARAEVRLEPRQGVESTGILRVLSDPGGEFRFNGLPGGTYLLHVEKRGYASADYGQTSAGEPGTPIVIEAEASFRAVVSLGKLGAINGEVVDENGVGLPEVAVSAYRVAGRARQVAATRTDDRGVFRLAGLGPGSYLVRTSARRLEDGLDLMPTYYPGAPSAAEARKLEVELDGEVTGVRLAPLTGKLPEVSGTFAANGTVLLASELSVREASTQPGVGFRFESVEPGGYAVVAVSADNTRSGYQEIAVGSEDRMLNLVIGSTPELGLACEIASDRRREAEGVSFYFRRSGFEEDSPQRLSCGQSAAFAPGRWQVAAVPPAGLYVSAILESGTGTGVQELLLLPGESRELRIVLGDSPATVSGEVRTREGDVVVGAPVFLRATTPDLERRIGGVRQTRTAADGIYRIPGLPPGRYELVSSYQIREPETEPWPGGVAETVEVDEADEKTVDLPLTTIR